MLPARRFPWRRAPRPWPPPPPRNRNGGSRRESPRSGRSPHRSGAGAPLRPPPWAPPTIPAPSSSQIIDYVKCKEEKTGGCCIWLMENVQPEIGKSRPFSAWSDVGNHDIDNSQPVYPIRGTYDDYQCSPPSIAGGFGAPKGQNCSVKKADPFVGICYKTTFGDWSCPVSP